MIDLARAIDVYALASKLIHFCADETDPADPGVTSVTVEALIASACAIATGGGLDAPSTRALIACVADHALHSMERDA